ncbi:MAG: type III pantothenate kinase [Firmicutes bacterium]|uniref:Type III pantothenate kinase n=1 Tax=Candidatus Onthovivens merdipullorum TaxID=2840889 RepID=A0A9D9GUI7_9BACL|nr:type III pantothenate kinase [Candidatus Onthovivens merdipullorum]
MILVCDLGNTMIKFGVYDGDNLLNNFSLKTDKNKSSDEYGVLLYTLLKNCPIDGAIISSVVPSLTKSLSEAIKKVTDVNSLIVSKNIKTKMPIKIDNPNELGSDMLIGAVGASKLYKNSILVVDLGTASKIYVIDKNSNFIGGIISSGLMTSLKALVNSTSLLLEVPLVFPKKVIGKNTKDCIQSGLLNSVVFEILGFSKDFENELGYPLKKIITGGFCRLFKEKLIDFEVIENLNLFGLKEIYRMNQYEK